MVPFTTFTSIVLLTGTSSIIGAVADSDVNNNDPITQLSNSCVGKEDGTYYLQLSMDEDNYMPVYLTCSNEYVILDVNKDALLIDYFSSFEDWHYKIAGPSNTDPVTWEDWFLPNRDDSESNYLISPDCSLCDETSDLQIYDTRTSYWLSGNMAKIYWAVFGFTECDMDPSSYICRDCSVCSLDNPCEPSDLTSVSDMSRRAVFDETGTCADAILPVDNQVETSRRSAQSIPTLPHYKPSIGTLGEFCVCYKPNDEYIEEYTLDKDSKQYQIVNSNININQIEISSDDSDDLSKIVTNSNGFKFIEKNKLLLNLFERGLGVDGYRPNEMSDEMIENNRETLDLRDTHIIYLTQSDFTHGTYRIIKSGTYVFTEDIVLDFNQDDDHWPRQDQSDAYPGAGAYREAYNLGFFAGITIETNFVTIDLNGHELRQSFSFYFDQRWFALIELSNQQFLPAQGPSFFGANAINVNDIIIKNGVLGLTSHFAIHGNLPRNLVVTNVHIKDFVTHGIQLNGYDGVVFRDIEIGPSSTYEYIRGHYGHGRVMLQRLRVIEETMDEDGTIDTIKVKFAKREKAVTITDIADRLEAELKFCKEYAMNRILHKWSNNGYMNPEWIESDEDREIWKNAKDTYIHENGIPSASGIVGIFLNFDSASVNTYAKYTLPEHQGKNAVIENVWIHNLQHDFVEAFAFGNAHRGIDYTTPFFTAIQAEMILGSEEKLRELRVATDEIVSESAVETATLSDDFYYVGNSLTDAYFAMWKLSDDWNLLGMLSVVQDYQDTNIAAFAFGDINASPYWRVECNQDTMSHSGKGILGLRIDGSRNIDINNLKITDLYQYSQLGSYACGGYEETNTNDGSGGQFRQRVPMQRGFSGNNLQAISIVSSQEVYFKGDTIINNLNNDYSHSYGLSIWTANEIFIDNNANFYISNFNSGIKLAYGTYKYEDKPNNAPESCAVRIETDPKSEYADYFDSKLMFGEDRTENDVIHACAVKGHTYCLGDNNNPSMYGSYLGDDSTLCDVQKNNDYKQAGVVYSSSKDNKNNNNGSVDDINLTVSIVVIISTVSVFLFLLIHSVYTQCKNKNKNKNNNNNNSTNNNNKNNYHNSSEYKHIIGGLYKSPSYGSV